MSELIHRPRRLRRTAALREMTRETRLDPANLIYPLFVCAGEGVRREIKSMPGVFNLSIDELVKECEGRGAAAFHQSSFSACLKAKTRRGAARSPKMELRNGRYAPSNAKSKT